MDAKLAMFVSTLAGIKATIDLAERQLDAIRPRQAREILEDLSAELDGLIKQLVRNDDRD